MLSLLATLSLPCQSSILGLIVWHAVIVARRRCWRDAAAYIASRLLLLGFFGGSAAALKLQGVDVHLHHLYLVGAQGAGFSNGASPLRH